MVKITFMGAGSTVFAKNVLGDVMLTPALCDSEIALYDIDPERLEESYTMVCSLNRNINENRATVRKYLGVGERREALKGASFVVNAIQVGLYEPCTVTDFEVPKKYGLRQTIADTLGIFRALRTIPVLSDFAEDMSAVCPDALFLNYTNPMAMLAGYMQRYTGIRTVGLCHSVQVCTRTLFRELGMEPAAPVYEKIAGINHMAFLLECRDAEGNDLYPEIRRRARGILENPPEGFRDLVRLEYIRRFGGALPRNYITKAQARALGWRGGPLEPFAPGKSIGGDRFGNYERRLPAGSYRECDIDTKGSKSRGEKRIVYAEDCSLIYYTEDHYKSFELLYGEEP